MAERLTKFLKISNNNNPSIDFCIENTIQRNPSSRISALRTQYNLWIENGRPDAQKRNVFRWFELDYSFYVVHREKCSKKDIPAIKEQIYMRELMRMNPTLFCKKTEEEIPQVALKQESCDLAADRSTSAQACAS
jgi:hypothetical protein